MTKREQFYKDYLKLCEKYDLEFRVNIYARKGFKWLLKLLKVGHFVNLVSRKK